MLLQQTGRNISGLLSICIIVFDMLSTEKSYSADYLSN